MSYSSNQYRDAIFKLGKLHELLKKGNIDILYEVFTPEELREPLRIATEACCLLEGEDYTENVGRIIRHLYLDKKPVKELNPDDVDTIKKAVEKIELEVSGVLKKITR